MRYDVSKLLTKYIDVRLPSNLDRQQLQGLKELKNENLEVIFIVRNDFRSLFQISSRYGKGHKGRDHLDLYSRCCTNVCDIVLLMTRYW